MSSIKRILLGMSGGTDSSTAAILLAEAGYEVTGVTFRFFEPDQQTGYIDEAAHLAHRLGIRHLVYDARAEFETQIVGYFINEYLSGRTPVPCVYCNNTFKWPLLAQIADREGITDIATGHYARITDINGSYYICQGEDPDKDQSFFLWGLPQSILQRAHFPLGDLLKSEVKQIALDRGFERVATRKESMGVCFCPGDYRSFLQSRLPAHHAITPGDFIDSNGKVLGQHQGYPYYTVGQRRGLIHLNRAVFVKETDRLSNRVTLAPLSELYKSRLFLKEVNIVSPDEIRDKDNIICRIRYRKQESVCRIVPLPNRRAEVWLREPEHSVAPGQNAVFYIANRVVGGGIIERAE